MKYYTYKVTFEDLPGYFYYGRHKHNDDMESYLGSPKTWRHFWEFYGPKKEIIQWYDTYKEVCEAEDSLIRGTWANPKSLNEAIGPKISERVCRENGQKSYERGTGLFSLDKESHRQACLKGVETHRERGTGFFNKELNIRNGRMANEKGLGAMTPEVRKKARDKTVSMGVGVHTPEARRKGASSTNSQKWMCTVTGKVSNPGNLSKYQKARGIDPKNRVKVDG